VRVRHVLERHGARFLEASAGRVEKVDDSAAATMDAERLLPQQRKLLHHERARDGSLQRPDPEMSSVFPRFTLKCQMRAARAFRPVASEERPLTYVPGSGCPSRVQRATTCR
jgi:hypothetical protein